MKEKAWIHLFYFHSFYFHFYALFNERKIMNPFILLSIILLSFLRFVQLKKKHRSIYLCTILLPFLRFIQLKKKQGSIYYTFIHSTFISTLCSMKEEALFIKGSICLSCVRSSGEIIKLCKGVRNKMIVKLSKWPGWKNNSDKMHTCPRDWHPSAPCGPNWGPLKFLGPPQHNHIKGGP